MRYAPLRNVPYLIQHHIPFRGNSMRGEWFQPGESIPNGLLNDEERLRLRLLDPQRGTYVVFSYATPIAYCHDHVWHIVAQKFSRTTSRHQSLVRRGALPSLAA